MPRGVFCLPATTFRLHPTETDQANDRRCVPCLRHHAARRGPAGGAEPDRGRQAGHRAAARRVRRRLHRGRLARGDPQGHRVLPAGPDRARPPARAARRVRRDPPARRAGGRRPPGRRAARVRGAGRDSCRQESRPACPAGPADHAGGEPGDDPGHGQPPAGRGAAGVPGRGALLRRVPVRPGLRAGGGPGRHRGRRGRGRAVRHQRRDAPGRAGRRRHRGGRGHRRPARHPLPRRHRVRGGQQPGRGGRRGQPRAGLRQRLRRAVRQRQPVQRGRQAAAQEGPGRAARRLPGRDEPGGPRDQRGDQRRAQHPPALRRLLRVRAQGRAARLGGQGRPDAVPAHRPGAGRQRHADAGLRHGRPRLGRAQGQAARLRPVRRQAHGRPGGRAGSRSWRPAGTRSRPPTPRSSCCSATSWQAPSSGTSTWSPGGSSSSSGPAAR